MQVDAVLPDALPKDDWSFLYREKVLPLIDIGAWGLLLNLALFAAVSGRWGLPVATSVRNHPSPMARAPRWSRRGSGP